ncbi:guanine nucleotide binding protein (G protein), alpha activating activity polypeptide O [Reticulomyxa filosa]|uniref:Guanine nucleotide binding protein (G protein), alpha activating activity polypeptide O n=1 Tax=Reticulomyxa filosa TaxID=46433 RepID=X6NA68_RETFI|nr:guanine nucleotide binding protein (G protein), alpha activating activity polypeptide O [Reticulomyxa filosa]|eukprot:ETO22891.1 guanine nucleotide binding protein (G protein), alpha activating activity polypeptide O [Reticulomyxa filosa]
MERKKILLLGAGSGGKSTFLKQITYLYKYDNSNDFFFYFLDSHLFFLFFIFLRIYDVECEDFPELRLHRNSLSDTQPHSKTTIKYALIFFFVFLPGQSLKCEEQSSEYVKLLLTTEEFDEKSSVEVLTAMKKVAKDYEFTLNDNAEYFITDIDRIASIDYEPTFADVLRTRTKTTGVVKEEFLYQKMREPPKRYLLVDVGGQRSERNKWIGQFADIFAVLWFFALSSYDQVRLIIFFLFFFFLMYEELEVFHTTSKNPALERVSFIVFLNKYDQFIEKIGRIPFKCSFQNHEYDGDKHDPVQVIDWIEKTLKELGNSKTMYFHKTTATGTLIKWIVYLENATKSLYKYNSLEPECSNIDLLKNLSSEILESALIQVSGPKKANLSHKISF